MEKIVIYNDYITPEQEVELLSKIEELIAPIPRNRLTTRRYVFGMKYNSNYVSPVIPDFLQALADRIISEGKAEDINSVMINKYIAGNKMYPHNDGDGVDKVITVLSLRGAGVLIFTKEGGEPFTIQEPQRSLLQISEDLKKLWDHEVPPVEEERISIIFRKIIPIKE